MSVQPSSIGRLSDLQHTWNTPDIAWTRSVRRSSSGIESTHADQLVTALCYHLGLRIQDAHVNQETRFTELEWTILASGAPTLCLSCERTVVPMIEAG